MHLLSEIDLMAKRPNKAPKRRYSIKSIVRVLLFWNTGGPLRASGHASGLNLRVHCQRPPVERFYNTAGQRIGQTG